MNNKFRLGFPVTRSDSSEGFIVYPTFSVGFSHSVVNGSTSGLPINSGAYWIFNNLLPKEFCNKYRYQFKVEPEQEDINSPLDISDRGSSDAACMALCTFQEADQSSKPKIIISCSISSKDSDPSGGFTNLKLEKVTYTERVEESKESLWQKFRIASKYQCIALVLLSEDAELLKSYKNNITVKKLAPKVFYSLDKEKTTVISCEKKDFLKLAKYLGFDHWLLKRKKLSHAYYLFSLLIFVFFAIICMFLYSLRIQEQQRIYLGGQIDSLKQLVSEISLEKENYIEIIEEFENAFNKSLENGVNLIKNGDFEKKDDEWEGDFPVQKKYVNSGVYALGSNGEGKDFSLSQTINLEYNKLGIKGEFKGILELYSCYSDYAELTVEIKLPDKEKILLDRSEFGDSHGILRDPLWKKAKKEFDIPETTKSITISLHSKQKNNENWGVFDNVSLIIKTKTKTNNND